MRALTLRTTLITLASALGGLGASAQSQSYLRSSGTIFTEEASEVAALADGGSIVTGFFQNQGASEATLMRLDPSGNFVWRQSTGSAQGFKIFSDAVETNTGDIYAVGTLDSFPWIVQFDGRTGDEQRQFVPTSEAGQLFAIEQGADGRYVAVGALGLQLYACQFDDLGFIQWRKTYGQINFEGATALTATADGGYVIAGRTQRNAGQNVDLLVKKIDSNGNELWTRTYGTSESDGVKWNVGIDETPSGDLVLSATMNYNFVNRESDDVWVARLSGSNGQTLTHRLFDFGYDYARNIMATPDNGCVFVADTTPDGQTENIDVWIVKLRENLTVEWAYTYGGPDTDVADGLGLSGTDILVSATTRSFSSSISISDFWNIRLNADGTTGCSCFVRANALPGAAILSGLNQTPHSDSASNAPGGFTSNVLFASFSGALESAQCASNSGAWTDLGFGLAGENGVPCLSGVGSLETDTFLTTLLDGARPNAFATLIVGSSELNAPLLGGRLIPQPQLILTLPTGNGQITLPTTWPSSLPSGFELYVQYLIEDPAAPFGFAFSNAVVGRSP